MNVTVLEAGEEARLMKYLHDLEGSAVVIFYPGRDKDSDSWHFAPIELIHSVCGTNVTEASESSESSEEKLRENIERSLVRMGFRQGQSGFYNIVEAIVLISQSEHGQPIRVTSDIYPRVAKRRGSTTCSVERTIRNAIESVWKRSNLRTLREMYPYPCDNLNGRPTNAEFLINMAGEFRS
ncbi:MAG: sporulation initiation factor Spo0A C-terminal domain-containing protein [bacterium]|nr:sporulation initiation factor Spo0A C-terminal domain-containing protein [bacterium]MDY4098896.1 sporulation initiation factor Spo0A C-terminal domain-containing protein [Lachnospiraceae bacterium]